MVTQYYVVEMPKLNRSLHPPYSFTRPKELKSHNLQVVGRYRKSLSFNVYNKLYAQRISNFRTVQSTHTASCCTAASKTHLGVDRSCSRLLQWATQFLSVGQHTFSRWVWSLRCANNCQQLTLYTTSFVLKCVALEILVQEVVSLNVIRSP